MGGFGSGAEAAGRRGKRAMKRVRRLAALIRGWLSRRAARKLLAARLPRGLPAASEPLLEPALRVPARLDFPEGELWTVLPGAEIIRGRGPRRLLRLGALPPPLRDPGVVRLASFRLDAELRLPIEVDPLRVPFDAQPPVRPRRTPPRTPLARAPLVRLRPRNFRLEPGSFAPANQAVLPLPRPDPALRWVSPALRREKVELPWMARHRIRFLGPLQTEWFAAWWEQSGSHAAGAKGPRPYDLPRELGWALEICKEQMLIRRDVKKDEAAPEPQKLAPVEVGPASVEPLSLSGLIPEKQWLEPPRTPGPLPWDRSVQEACLRRWTLMGALEER